MNKRYAAFALIALALVAAGAAHAQTLVITPNPISFYAQVGTSSSASQTVTVKSSDNTTAIPFTVSPGNSWINPISGTPAGGWVTPATFSVSVNPSQLQLGTTTGSMIVSGVAGSGLFVAVPVNVTMSTISVGLPGGQTSSLSLGTYAAGSPVYPSPVSALTVSGDTTNLTVTKGSVDNWYTFQVFGTPPSAVQVSFNAAVAASLTPGTLTGTLTLTPEGANPVPVKITITLTVTQSPQVTVNPASLVFNWQRSGANQTQQFFTLNSNSPQAVSVSLSTPGVSWITLPVSNPTIPANGSVQVAVQVAQAAGDAQPAGANNGSIQISIPGGGALFPNGTTSLSFPITLNVSNYPMLYVPASLLSYTYQFGSTTTPAPQVLVPIGTSSGTPVNFTVASSTASWLSIQPPPGSLLNTPSSFTVSVNPAGLAPGTYTSSVTVIPGANGSGQGTITIPVVLTVTFQNSLLTSLPTNTLVFPYQVGQSTPASQTVNLSSYTGAPLNYTVTPPAATAAWVQVTGPLSGTTDNTSFTVSINPSGIPAQPWPPYLDATINIAATDPSTQSPVNSVSVDVRLYVSTAAQLVVTPPGPVQLSFYPNSPYYPSSNQAILSLASTLPVTSELNITSIQRTGVAPGATSPWIGGLDSGPLTPTSLTVNGTVLYSASMLPGTYNGSVSISATGGLSATPVADSGISIPVQFTVNRALGSVTWPKAADGSMSFTQTKGGQVPAAQVVQVGTDSISLPFDVVVNTGLYNWLTISGITSNTPGSFNVSVDASNLAIGTWRGAIYVDMPNAAGSPFRIPVTFYVNGGAICAGSCSSPTQSLSFTQIVGGATPAAQPVAIVSTPSSATYTISAATTTPPNGNWLLASISAGGGITPGTVTVSVNPGSLAAGTYNGTVTITSPGATGSPIVIQVTLTVQQASITASTTPLVFNQLAGGPAPAAQQVVVTSTPSGVPFAVAATTGNGAPWIIATAGASGTSGTTGTASGTVQISVNGASLSPGPYTGLVTITSAGAVGSPISIPVLLTVGPAVQLGVSQSTLTFAASVGQATTPQTVQLTSTASTTYTVTTATKDNGAWLTVNPTSGTAGTAAVTLTVSANTQTLAAGGYSGTVTISSSSSLTPAIVNVSLTVTAVPAPVVTAVVNAASWVAGAVSPGENIVIGGTGIGPATLVVVQQLTAAGKFPTTLGNTQVFFDGIAAPIIYASATQTSVMVPYAVGGRTSTNLQVVYSNVPSVAVPYNVVQAAPGIYAQNSRGFGPGSVVNADGTINGPNNPAAKGSEVYLYMTGEGATNPASTDGAIANTSGNPLNKPILPVTVTVSGVPATTIQYWGSAPGIIYGVMQVNFTIPPGTPTGAQPLLVSVGSNTTPASVTVAVQ